ncbi:FAD-binding oxidoreductase [Paraburkholderia sp. DHOC27]|uniref:FAD-binding oxidoreductase n=1 Tax=Paraburkholderia sp. DHOC27 TaxID=2303330 RepID=UPI000E3CBCE4|nr:FAD-linked oxidase C-terminal domain-containing protein [Paraburkholderia sp. DHOC27]RFU49752.1 FAD-binding protein [Paraburkholderia sp. DHOC27]
MNQPHEAVLSSAQPATAPLPVALVDALRALLGERFSTAASTRDHHGHGESYHASRPPAAVCFAQSTDEVSAIVKLCAQQRTPIIPFGAGTSLEGHVTAPHGGVCIDLGQMNAILNVRPADLDVTVQAGVTRQQLNTYLRDTGLFFPVDPGAECTLGGMAATRASGTNAVRYGTMRENVVSLTVVVASGEIIRTSGRARKSAAGYDLTRLFVGSEGTLGIITEVTLRLYGVPEATSVAICPFDDLKSAASAVATIIQMGIPVARVEFLDKYTIRATNQYSGTTYREVPTLFFEFHGSEREVHDQAALAQQIAEDHGASGFEWTADPQDRARIWKARHTVHYALQSMRPNGRIWSTDVCVPISALAGCIEETHRDIEAASFYVGIVGHVGDGNFHLGMVLDPDNPAEMAEAERINERLVHRAIAAEGTSTGEHGVGTGKIKYMELEHGGGVKLMHAIKRALDPDNLFNPGKILPSLDL